MERRRNVTELIGTILMGLGVGLMVISLMKGGDYMSWFFHEHKWEPMKVFNVSLWNVPKGEYPINHKTNVLFGCTCG